MQFAIATHIRLAKPETAAHFLKDALGFDIEFRQGYGWWAENGSITLILQEGLDNIPMIEVQCTDIENDSAALLQRPDIQALSERNQQGNRIEHRLISDCGITLLLSKVLNEDDMGELLKLPTTLAWDEQTALQTRRILRIAPLSFRKSARQRVTERAEYLAIEAGDLCVQHAHAMQSFLDITLNFQYEALFDAMREEGIDPAPYMQQTKSRTLI
ncbi:MAG: hypothetical protein Q9M20_04245 [Mariprofundaceae bacterium]|nr:hypothetical protein [Mariprofundaceae bacterium]